MRRKTGAMSIGAAFKREKLRRLARALDPVDMILHALLQESRDSDPGVADAATHLLHLRFEKFVVGLPNDFGNTRLERN